MLTSFILFQSLKKNLNKWDQKMRIIIWNLYLLIQSNYLKKFHIHIFLQGEENYINKTKLRTMKNSFLLVK